jgi:hypothetical protein
MEGVLSTVEVTLKMFRRITNPAERGNPNSTTSKDSHPSETTLKNPQNVKTEGEAKYNFK